MFHEYLHHAPPNHVADEEHHSAWTWDRIAGLVGLAIFAVLLLMSLLY